jgi:hypothetical protein
MNVELENIELMRKQHECRKFYKEINMARKQFKPMVHICRNEQDILDRWIRHFDKLLNGRKIMNVLLLLPQLVIKY